MTEFEVNRRLTIKSAATILEEDFRKIVDEEKLRLSDELKKYRVEGILQLMTNCNFIGEICYPIKKDVGDYELITAYRSHHCKHMVPMIGGIFLHPCVTLEDVMGLSTINTFKSANVGIPFGGSQGAIRICPDNFTYNDIQKITRRYIIELVKKNVLGPGIDCGYNDLNVGHREISWMTDTYRKTFGSTDVNALAVMCGKPTMSGGLPGNLAAVGLGIYYFMDYLLKNESLMECIDLSPGWKGKTFIVEGFGNVGKNTAIFFEKAGAKMIGVIEKDSAFIAKDGFKTEDMAKHKDVHGTIKDYKDGKKVDLEEVRSTKCDFFILSALYKSVRKSNADVIDAKIVIEAANAAITPAAEKILQNKGMLIIPDICANGGGMLSCYFEFLKNIRHVAFGRLSSGVGDKLTNLLECMYEALQESSGKKRTILPPKEELKNLFPTSEKDIIEKNIAKHITDSACMTLKTADKYELGTDLRMAAYCRTVLRVFKSHEYTGLAV